MKSPGAAGPKPVFGNSGNRAVAFLLDATLLIFAMAALSTLMPPGLPATVANWSLALLYFGALPATKLRATPGKLAAGIDLRDRAGQRLGSARSVLRAAAMLGWIWLAGRLPQLRPEPGPAENLVMLGWMVFFLAWAPMGFTRRGESAFDLLAGTLVVRRGASPDEIAAAEPRKHSPVEVALPVVMCLVLAVFIDTATYQAHMRNLRARVGYAVEATTPLRDKLEAFHAREGRWPTAAELGVPEWTPYPDGGGYRLQRDGVVEIGFSVLPELKGRTVTLRPATSAGSGAIDWKCRADPALHKRYLSAPCR